MDFYGILFDMKNGKKIPYSKNYFDTMFAAKLEELGVKTITGTLPLTFRTSETALRSWTIYGNNTQHKYSSSGTLPLTFTTHTAGAASDWSISGNDNIGKNKFETSNISETWYAVKWSVENGVLKGVGTYGDNASHTRPRLQGQLPAGSYILSGSHDYTTTSTRLQIGTCTDSLGTNFANLGYDEGSGFSFTLQADSWVSIRVWTAAALYQQAIDVSIPIMIRPADTSPDFEPYQVGVGQKKTTIIANTDLEQGYTATDTSKTYEQNKAFATNRLRTPSLITVINNISNIISINDGYEFAIRWYSNGLYAASTGWNTYYTIPANFTYNSFGLTIRKPDNSNITNAESITITIQEQTYSIPLNINNTTQDIYIGSTPLTAGQSISKTSTGVDITAIAGTNTITTELYNKPEMAIEGVDYVGVGRPRGQDWEIRLVCVGELSPYKPNAPESDTSYVYNATDYTLDTDGRYKTALIDIGEGYQKIFTIGKTKGETFTIQPLDYMAEWGGVDHYNQIGQTITPTEETYTGETAAQYLLVTYYDSEVDTLTPKEIRESITLTATVDANTIIPIDAPLTEGQSVSKESTGVDIETFQHANNTLMEYAIESSNIEMSITYKGG